MDQESYTVMLDRNGNRSIKSFDQKWIRKTSELITEDVHQKIRYLKVWRLRVLTLRELLIDGYSVFVSDVDSLWNKKIELNTLPGNFDIIYAVCHGLPSNQSGT